MSAELQAFVRVAYGVLMLATLVAALPHVRRYFFSERWGGYTASSAVTDALQNPYAGSAVLAAWMIAASALVGNRAVVAAAAVNFACCYYFFNRLRWTSVSRGMGAPGFIAMWLGAAVLLLELSARHAPDLRDLALLVLRVDFGAIMLTAGLYKLAAGYRQRQGMELGMVNPEWGYWPTFWKAFAPSHPLLRVFNELAWSTEVVCGVLMLIPSTRALGAAGILLSFVFIATQIRLGFLCEMVMVCCLVFFVPGSLVDRGVVSAWHSIGGDVAAAGAPLSPAIRRALGAGLWAYLLLLPVARAGMFYNQLRHRSLPRMLQRVLDAYASVFGLILWRVFTADVVNFFVRVWEQPAGGARRLVSDFHGIGWSRFSQVAECIALTSVFTTLKYHPSQPVLFSSRLLRYARTIPRQPASRLVFEWVNVAPAAARFDYVPIAEFDVDVDAGTIDEKPLNDSVSVRAAAQSSPVHEGARPGSYAPLTP